MKTERDSLDPGDGAVESGQPFGEGDGVPGDPDEA
jgi:hypothetical protein